MALETRSELFRIAVWDCLILGMILTRGDRLQFWPIFRVLAQPSQYSPNAKISLTSLACDKVFYLNFIVKKEASKANFQNEQKNMKLLKSRLSLINGERSPE